MLVNDAYVEFNFSNLKLLKNYLISAKSQEKFKGLAILYTEEVIIGHIDVDTIIIYFAYLNGRRNCFI
jgi:hypothetical protein